VASGRNKTGRRSPKYREKQPKSRAISADFAMGKPAARLIVVQLAARTSRSEMKTSVVEFGAAASSITGSHVSPSRVAQRSTDGVLLMNLGRGQCRYAIGEDANVTGRHLFCAAATLPDRPYCEHHHRIVTNVEPRRSAAPATFRLKAA
jgi:hypothetical protein